MVVNSESPLDSWSVVDAKARLSEVIERARHRGPQTITRHGRSAVVVVDAELWERTRKRGQGNFADFLMASPLRGSGLEVSRLKGGVREVDQ